jgi:hypothetical protein
MVERRTDLMRIANMTDDDESAMKNICKKFATEITYNREFEYYSVTFTEENWLLAVIEDHNIERYLK